MQPQLSNYIVREGEKIVYKGRKFNEQNDWLKMPATGMKIDEANGYALWLQKSKKIAGARICSEIEWERAARGADQREFPHGNEIDGTESNIDETHGKDANIVGLDEVGLHSASRSPFGLEDMAGNAFEWVTSSLVNGELLLRSSSYFQAQMTARSTNRNVVGTLWRDPGLGFRICADVVYK